MLSDYPMRINKYLAQKGISTRRAADALIERGSVFINDRKAQLGDKVTETDKVEVRDKREPKRYLYLAYNKPVGVITHSPQLGEQDIQSATKLKNVFPIGRLDKDSSGLIILTSDGRITDRLLNPKYDHDKEYRVEVEQPLREGFKKAVEEGIDIEGYRTAPAKVRKTGTHTFNITLTEGKKHQIRRMVSALYNSVVSLERVRILNVRLDDLAPGEWRPIQGEELQEFLKRLGL
jgi:23S rRNA pseudouridine2604 synthase